MHFIESLCPPALLYLLFIVVQVGLDLALGLYMTAGVKLLSGGVGTVLLNTFCGIDLGIVSWAIIATPFLMTALAMSISLGLGLDRAASQMVKENFESKPKEKHMAKPKEKDDAPVPSNSIY